jgi:AcrR family transcriptional regulator
MARAGLSTERLVQLAIDQVDEHGYEALTLSKLADAAGVRQPSLYKHVSNVAHLQQLLAVAAGKRLSDALTNTPIHTERPIEALLQAYRTFAAQHPGLHAAITRAPQPDDTDLHAALSVTYEVLCGMLATYGVSDERSMPAATAVHAALYGFAELERLQGQDNSHDAAHAFFVELLDAGLRNMDAGAGRRQPTTVTS